MSYSIIAPASSSCASGAKTIVKGLASNGVAVGGGHLYWSNSGPGTIVEANLNGTGATPIAKGQNSPSGVAVGP